MSEVIWAKTDAGRAEMQAKALVADRVRRSLLLLIDGQKTEDTLLAGMAGITPQDFAALEAQGLIQRVPSGTGRSGAEAPTARPTRGAGPATPAAAADPERLAAALGQLITRELGMRGFSLTLALDKAKTMDELIEVARRTVEQVRERKGAAAAEAVRRMLFGR